MISMKLRIRDNSVRLRLERSEVDTLRDENRVAASTRFAEGIEFVYAVESDTDCDSPAAIFAASTIVVRLPAAAVSKWADSEQVSLEGEQVVDGNSTLAILVEKDFACLAPREGEDESDMFPHPQADDPSVSC